MESSAVPTRMASSCTDDYSESLCYLVRGKENDLHFKFLLKHMSRHKRREVLMISCGCPPIILCVWISVDTLCS